jgi:hypothetical protein
MTTARLHTDGSPILFCLVKEEGEKEILAWITSQAFFEKEGHLDDQIRCPEDCEKWWDEMEAMMGSRCFTTIQQAKENLISQGFVYSQAMQEFIDGQEE